MANPKIPALLELRKELEKELEELRERIRRIEEYIGALDVSITSGSFATADSAIAATQPTASTPVTDAVPEQQSIVLFNKGRDIELATLEITSQEIMGIPAPHAVYDIKRGAFARFFVERILGKFQEEDRHKVEAGEMTWDEAFDFEVRADDGILEEISIKNYGGGARLSEIERALRWALEKIYRTK